MRRTVKFDNVCREEHRDNLAVAVAHAALAFADETLAAQFVPKRFPIGRISPQTEFEGVLAKHLFEPVLGPGEKRFIGEDITSITKAGDGHENRASHKSRAETRLRFAKQTFRACSLRFLERERNHDREGGSEINLFGRPLTHRAHMLVTKNSHQLTTHPNWRIQHGRN